MQLIQLRSRYAPFTLSPELAQRIEAQFDRLEPVVQRNEQALAFTQVMNGRYAPTLLEARQAFPGRQIHMLATPGSGAPLFVPSDRPDSWQQAEALQLVQNARTHAEATGDTSRLDALLDDPTFRDVARVPGNRASEAYSKALHATRTVAAAPAAEYFLGGDYRVLQRQPHGTSAGQDTDSDSSRTAPPVPAPPPAASVAWQPSRSSAMSTHHGQKNPRPAAAGPAAANTQATKAPPPREPKKKNGFFDSIIDRNRAISDPSYEDQLRAAGGMAEVVRTGTQLAADINPVTSLAQLLEGRSVTGDEYDSTDYLLEAVSLVPLVKILPAIRAGSKALKALEPVAEIAALGHRYKVPTDPEKLKKIRALTKQLYKEYQPKIKLKRSGPERPSQEHPGQSLQGIAFPATKTIELYPGSNQASLLEELLHIKQIVDEDQLGKIATQIDIRRRDRWELEVHTMLLELGFEPLKPAVDWSGAVPRLPTKRRGG